MTRWLLGLAVGVAAAVVVALTVPGGGAAESAAPPATISASLTDFAITVDVEALRSSAPVTFAVVNDGQLPHDLAIQDGPATPVLATGETTSITYEPSGPGQVYLVCTVPGHEAAGMHLTLPVTAN
jgi:hypothetical protein